MRPCGRIPRAFLILIDRSNPSKLPEHTHFPSLAGNGAPVAHASPRKADILAQRIIEIVIGRLITDEQFRFEFLRDPHATLTGLSDRGLELSRTETAALLNIDRTLWARIADAIDPRLQKASLTTGRVKPASTEAGESNV